MAYFPEDSNQSVARDHRVEAEAGVEILDEVFAHVRDHVDWRHA